MNKLLKTANLPFLVLGTAVLGALVRLWLYATGLDGKGLLTPNHAGHILIWLITLAAVAAVLLGTLRLKQAPKYSFNFPPSLIGAAGAAIAAGGMLATALIQLFSGGDAMIVFTGFAGLICALVLLFLANCRYKGMHPTVLFPGVLCVYMILHMVCLYRTWSADPQIQDYCFALFASVSLTMACYHSAAFCANSGNRQMHTIFHLCSVFFCIVGLPRSDMPLFYLSMGIWMFTDLCNLRPMPRTVQE